MIIIRRRRTGEELARVPGDSLAGARLAGVDLQGADLAQACLAKADLSGADLAGADLRGAIFTECSLRDVQLKGASLSGAVFTGGSLAQAKMSRSDLRLARIRRVYMKGCDLRHCDLRGARLEAVDLEEAVFNHANLRGTILAGASLRGANLTNASFGDTALQCCADLHEARGLYGVAHTGPSWLDLQTLRISVSRLPDRFLDGVGMTRRESAALRELYGEPASFESVYVTAAVAEGDLGWGTVCALQEKNIPSWLLLTGEAATAVRRPLRAGPRNSCRWVVVCSEAFLRSQEAVEVLSAAVEVERRLRMQVIYPVRVDDFLFGEEILDLADEAIERGAWRTDWVRYLRALQVADWSRWQEKKPWESALTRLIADLGAPAPR